MLKNNVRKIAKENQIITAGKKDSQGLCFIGKVKLPDFLQQKLKPKKGDVILIKDTHNNYFNREKSNNYDALSQNYFYEKFDVNNIYKIIT
mgnify:FL=1